MMILGSTKGMKKMMNKSLFPNQLKMKRVKNLLRKRHQMRIKSIVEL